jgi:preprotein translocase subunit SecG
MLIYNFLLIVQIIVALSIIGLVLIQHGKGADAGAAFGGGSSGTVFGSRGSSNFLSRSTGILAAVFFANSLALAWLVAHRGDSDTFSSEKSVVPQVKIEKVRAAPVVEPVVAVPSDVPANVGNPDKVDTETQQTTPAKESKAPVDVPASVDNSVPVTKDAAVVTTPADVPQ